jgi:hypothetical protein
MHPSEVAKVILEAVKADNPDFRYAVGKDAAMTIEARKTCLIWNFKTYSSYSLTCRILINLTVFLPIV